MLVICIGVLFTSGFNTKLFTYNDVFIKFSVRRFADRCSSQAALLRTSNFDQDHDVAFRIGRTGQLNIILLCFVMC
uniref:Uncharacterized protein n=1 Tax=Strigamia maritima TaxID=126957 RepID=T1JJW9_STRMM